MKPLASALCFFAFVVLLVKGFNSNSVMSTAEAATPPVGQAVIAATKAATVTKTITKTTTKKTATLKPPSGPTEPNEEDGEIINSKPTTSRTTQTKTVQTKTVTKGGPTPTDE
ncbi:hypothetical protein KRR26_32310 [Corallococcus sp. M34]|uniref:hypothetical protein n=1 Tax=Citreicoccus inhibens TaxID=2849499 RepID=UPI0011C458BA|nr:hypothetical protein [Citreicoccus inhibens]MBU8900301.1 hypothetical protein [Citreicoccus inhibens]